MSVPEELLEVRFYSGEGYLPLVDFDAWRVAVLNYIDELLPDRITGMQRHDETDEIFVLLKGRCILFLGEGSDKLEKVHAKEMQPLQVYNVRRGAWHTHTLSKDAAVLIVENCDTDDHNSPCVALNPAQRQELVELTRALWMTETQAQS